MGNCNFITSSWTGIPGTVRLAAGVVGSGPARTVRPKLFDWLRASWDVAGTPEGEDAGIKSH